MVILKKLICSLKLLLLNFMLLFSKFLDQYYCVTFYFQFPSTFPVEMVVVFAMFPVHVLSTDIIRHITCCLNSQFIPYSFPDCS